jgi:type I restriction enzyme S subunit
VAFGTTELHVIRPQSGLDAQFLFYLTIAHDFRSFGEAEMLGAGGQKRVPEEFLKDWRTPLPPLETQQRIVRFLDEKTARIDGLIEKKRALLERLVEKRQALITRAVTKGLNPDAPVKPSGIDWLGDIPAHWELVPFKWRCRVQSGQVDPREPEYAVMPLIAPDHIESGTGRLYEVTSAEEQGAISGKYLCPVGSVLYSKIRPALRKVALYDAECLCSADMYAIDPGAHFDRQYLFYFLLTDTFTSYAELESLRVAMPKVNREALGAFPLPAPSRKEQAQIAAFCLDADQQHRRAGDQVRASIGMLERYRAAIITAAVTGQIADLA